MAYSRFQMERDEITAAGEFLNTHNISQITYQRDERGMYVVDQNDDRIYIHDIGQSSLEMYKKRAQLEPELGWQVDRVALENEHLNYAKTMPPGSVQVVVSDCPTAELDRLGRNEFGYQRQRGLGFIQLFKANFDGTVTIYGHSFDRNDAAGIQAMYGMFGEVRDESAWSLGQPIREHDAASVDGQELLERMLATYDSELARQYGGEWFAGRDASLMREEGNSFVSQQRDLLKTHCDMLERIGAKSDAASKLRYDFILAVRNRFEGGIVGSFDSVGGEMASAGEAGRENGEQVDFCGVSIGTVSEQMNQIGFHLESENAWHRGNCAACLNENVMVGACNVCKSCEDADTRGIDLMKVRERALRAKAKAEQPANPDRAWASQKNEKVSKPTSKEQLLTKKYGEKVQLRTVLKIGGAATFVLNSKGEILDTL